MDVTPAPENPLAHSLAQDSQIDPDVARLIDAWPTLPAAIRMGILAMIEAARNNHLERCYLQRLPVRGKGGQEPTSSYRLRPAAR
jgi:hypothetical protein